MTTVPLARLSYPAGGETGRNRGLSRPTEIDGFAVRDPTNVEIILTPVKLMEISVTRNFFISSSLGGSDEWIECVDLFKMSHNQQRRAPIIS